MGFQFADGVIWGGGVAFSCLKVVLSVTKSKVHVMLLRSGNCHLDDISKSA